MSHVEPKIFGVIDEDPFDFKTWSGSSRYFFGALQDQGVLEVATSAEASSFHRRLAQARNFHPNIDKWKFKYHLDTLLFDKMSRVANSKIDMQDTCNTVLQVGAWYDLIRSNTVNVSYHDGNLAALLNSPFGYPKINAKIINRALAYEKSIYERLDLIFPMSNWLAKSFIDDFDVEPSKVYPVGAGINLSAIADSESREYDGKTILMVGKDFERKGGPCLLEAFRIVRKNIPGARLRILGPELSSLPQGVDCLGFVDKSDPAGLKFILNEYMNASVFVLPSLYEPFGISFVEAMAHRLPCIGTNICAMPEIISEGQSGFLIEPNDSEALASRIIELLKEEDLCKQFGEVGFNSYINKYNWDTVGRNIIRHLKDIQQ